MDELVESAFVDGDFPLLEATDSFYVRLRERNVVSETGQSSGRDQSDIASSDDSNIQQLTLSTTPPR
jgi:hypothetical protein